MKNIQRKTSKQQIAYDFIRSQITQGHYGPGFRLIIEDIAKQLGTSPIPVREAIRQLEADGFIQSKPYAGAFVSIINEKEYVETLSVLAILEGYATSLSAKTFTEKEIWDLEEINDEMVKALNNWEFEHFSDLNRKFHTLIIEHCNNQFLVEIIKNTWQQLDHVRRSSSPIFTKRAPQSIEEHKHIIQLLQEQAASEEIEKYVREHKMNTVREFLKRQNEKKVE